MCNTQRVQIADWQTQIVAMAILLSFRTHTNILFIMNVNNTKPWNHKVGCCGHWCKLGFQIQTWQYLKTRKVQGRNEETWKHNQLFITNHLTMESPATRKQYSVHYSFGDKQEVEINSHVVDINWNVLQLYILPSPTITVSWDFQQYYF